MDIQIKELIETIRNDGVAVAESESAKIIENARKEAARLIDAAHQAAQTIKQEAQVEIARAEAASEEAIRQVGRDLILSFQKSIEEMLKRLIEKDVEKVLTDEVLIGLIEKCVTSELAQQPVVIEIAQADTECIARLQKRVRAQIAESGSDGITITPVPHLAHGFVIRAKGSNYQYEVSAKTIGELLIARLNPHIRKILHDD